MSRLLSWVGPAMLRARSRRRFSPPTMPRRGRRRGAPVNASDPRTLHEAYGRELAELLDAVLAGRLVDDWAAVERLVVRVVGALLRLQELHRVDEYGRCSICWPLRRAWWWPWPKRTTCTVHSSLSFHLRQPDRFVLAAITDSVSTVQSAS